MLLAMRLSSLLVPINDRLVRDAVLVIQRLLKSPTSMRKQASPTHKTGSHLHNLRERFRNPGILIAVHLHGVDERHLRLWVATERFEDFRKPLKPKKTNSVSKKPTG